MSGQPAPGPSLERQFGPFVFDETSGELRKHGIRLRLNGQPQQLLAALTRQPGQLVSREELRQELWADSTFVDFEHGLNAAMNRLRRVLADSPEHPRYIETVPGRGYRFVAEVRSPDARPVLVMPPAVPPQPDPETVSTPPAETHASRRTVVIAAAALALGSAAGYLAGRPAVPAPAVLRFTVAPPAGYAFEPASSRQPFALSPDGKQLAFTAKHPSGLYEAFVRDLETLETAAVPESKGTHLVFWAPDSRSLFLTVGRSLRRAGLKGDAHQPVCDAPVLMFGGTLMGPDLLISARRGNYIVPVSGGEVRPVPHLYPWPQLLPDGRRLLYTVYDEKSGRRRARTAEYGKPHTVRDLVETDSRTVYVPSVVDRKAGYLLFVREGNLLAQPFDPGSQRIRGEPLPIASSVYTFLPSGAADFTVSETGLLAYQRFLSRSQLAWVDRGGAVLKTVGPSAINVRHGRISPDGTKIAMPVYDIRRGASDIWVVDTATGVARKTIFGSGSVDSPVWSPDSRTLLYNLAGDHLPKLFVRGLGESDRPELLPEAGFQVAADWSRDGRFILFSDTAWTQSPAAVQGDVYLVDMARGRKLVHLIDTPYHESSPAFSPDGRWLAFASNETGRNEIYLQAFEGGERPRLVGERRLVTRAGVVALRWRPDGKEIFYLSFDGSIYAVPVSLGPNPAFGKPMRLFEIGLEARAAIHGLEGFDVSPDGRRFLVPVVTSPARAEFIVVQNWEAEALRNRGKPD